MFLMKSSAQLLLFVLSVGIVSAADLRRVDGKVYDVAKSEKWESFPHESDSYFRYWITVEQVVAGGLVVACEGKNYRTQQPDTVRYIFVKNHPDHATALAGGSLAGFKATRVGRTNYNGDMVALYDCGVAYAPTPAETAAAKEKLAAATAAAKQKELARKTEAAARRAASDAALLKTHQELAAQEDVYGLLRMGERYLSGDGVEKSEALARKFLEKAAAKGCAAAERVLNGLGTPKP